MRTRTYGGVGGREGNNPAYPICRSAASTIDARLRGLDIKWLAYHILLFGVHIYNGVYPVFNVEVRKWHSHVDGFFRMG